MDRMDFCSFSHLVFLGAAESSMKSIDRFWPRTKRFLQECLESLHEGRQYIVQYIMQSEAAPFTNRYWSNCFFWGEPIFGFGNFLILLK